MGTKAPVPPPDGQRPMMPPPPPPPRYSHDPAREQEWRDFEADLQRVRRELGQPFLDVDDGDRICELMARLCDLLRRERQ